MTYKRIKKMKFKKKQIEIAEEIGIRPETLSGIINGKRQCSKYLAKALIELYWWCKIWRIISKK